MMSETTVVDARLDKLERDNRRLKLTVGALLLALAAVPLIGAVMPEQTPEVIRARAFRVVDEIGTTRALMHAGGITYADENGLPRVIMADDGIAYYDENGNGNGRASMSESGIFYRDENGNPRVAMGGPGIHYQDENRNSVWSTTCAPNC